MAASTMRGSLRLWLARVTHAFEETFYRRLESIAEGLNLISQHALADSAVGRRQQRARDASELQNVMAHNSASDRRCQS